MEKFEKLKKVNGNIWFLLIFIFSALLYLYNINFSDFWIDEAFTKALVRHSFSEITGLIKDDFHPPLYFYALKIFVTIFGVSDFTVRLFSVVAVLSTILLGYFAGQRVFGKSGALYFCLLLLSLPMLAAYSHDARMYAWGAFTVTGVYLYSILFIKTNRKNDLLYLMLFSLIAAYTHYYALLAAFLANVFVLIFLLVRRNKNWRMHLIYSFIAILFYLPWLFVLLYQTKSVQKSFWVSPVNWDTILSCFTSPFALKYFLPPSWPLVIIIYGLMLFVLYRSFIVKKDEYKIMVGLSLFIFLFTVLITAIISLFSQPILYARYIANIAVMLLIPPAVFFVTVKNKFLKGILLAMILFYGITNSIDSSSFSFGPYRQSLDYLNKKHPEVKKVFHVVETTVGSFVEYNNSNIENYWYAPESTIVYTNMKVFNSLHTTNSLNKVLRKDEQFCIAAFPFLPFNEKNLKQIMSESQLVKIDTVADNKVTYTNILLLYILKYQGAKPDTISGS